MVAPLGSGGRFKTLAASLAKQPGIDSPDALAASIGRKKLGPKKFNALAAKGRAKYTAKKRHPAKGG